jgi:hypothetical protein
MEPVSVAVIAALVTSGISVVEVARPSEYSLSVLVAMSVAVLVVGTPTGVLVAVLVGVTHSCLSIAMPYRFAHRSRTSFRPPIPILGFFQFAAAYLPR